MATYYNGLAVPDLITLAILKKLDISNLLTTASVCSTWSRLQDEVCSSKKTLTIAAPFILYDVAQNEELQRFFEYTTEHLYRFVYPHVNSSESEDSEEAKQLPEDPILKQLLFLNVKFPAIRDLTLDLRGWYASTIHSHKTSKQLKSLVDIFWPNLVRLTLIGSFVDLVVIEHLFGTKKKANRLPALKHLGLYYFPDPQNQFSLHHLAWFFTRLLPGVTSFYFGTPQASIINLVRLFETVDKYGVHLEQFGLYLADDGPPIYYGPGLGPAGLPPRNVGTRLTHEVLPNMRGMLRAEMRAKMARIFTRFFAKSINLPELTDICRAFPNLNWLAIQMLQDNTNFGSLFPILRGLSDLRDLQVANYFTYWTVNKFDPLRGHPTLRRTTMIAETVPVPPLTSVTGTVRLHYYYLPPHTHYDLLHTIFPNAREVIVTFNPEQFFQFPPGTTPICAETSCINCYPLKRATVDRMISDSWNQGVAREQQQGQEERFRVFSIVKIRFGKLRAVIQLETDEEEDWNDAAAHGPFGYRAGRGGW